MKLLVALLAALALLVPVAAADAHYDYKGVDLQLDDSWWSTTVLGQVQPVYRLDCWGVTSVGPGATIYTIENAGANHGSYGVAVMVNWTDWHGSLIDGGGVTGSETRQFKDSTYDDTVGTRRVWIDANIDGQILHATAVKWVHQGGPKAYAIRNNC